MVKRLAEVKRLADAQPKNSDSICDLFLRISKESNPACFGEYIGDEFCLSCCFKSRYDIKLAQKILPVLVSVLKKKKDEEQIEKDSFFQPMNLVKETLDCRYHSSFRIRLKVKEIKNRFPFWKNLQRERFLKEIKKIVETEREKRKSQKDKGRENRDYWINKIIRKGGVK